MRKADKFGPCWMASRLACLVPEYTVMKCSMFSQPQSESAQRHRLAVRFHDLVTPDREGLRHASGVHTTAPSVATISRWRYAATSPVRVMVCEVRMSADEAPTPNQNAPGSVTKRILGS